MLKSVLLVLTMFAMNAIAKNAEVTCTGGQLYITTWAKDGSTEVCWERIGTCTGEWSQSYEFRPGPKPDKGMAGVNAMSADSKTREVTSLIQSATPSDFRLFLAAPTSVMDAFKKGLVVG